MDKACPQCRVKVEKGKVNGWVSESGRQWIHGRKMKGGLKHLVIWRVSLDVLFSSFLFLVFLLLVIFKEF